jgi:molybdate transport system regulatory protein
MRLSIRNQLPGVVEAVTRGEVMGTVLTRLGGGQHMTAAITLDAIDDLKLARGEAVTVLVKSTEVSVSTDPVAGLSIRNQIAGTVFEVDHGAVMSVIKVTIEGGETITAAITKDGAESLELAPGDAVTVLVKSTEVALAVE